jgi:hypothetical protein
MARIQSTPDEIEKYLGLLEATIERITTLSNPLTEELLAASPDGKEWSACAVLAHLRACSDLWTHSIYAMLTENAPKIPPIDERKWAKTTRYAEYPFRQSLKVFGHQRNELIVVLRGLRFEAWERRGVVEKRGMSVFSQVRRMALHEAEHCDQLEILVGKFATLR